jgi:hypothetical protein
MGGFGSAYDNGIAEGRSQANATFRAKLESAEARIRELEAQLSPITTGTKEAVCEAVRLLCGEAPTYIENSDQWTLPDTCPPFGHRATAVRRLVHWLDVNAVKGGE